jgi:hypothetical protein
VISPKTVAFREARPVFGLCLLTLFGSFLASCSLIVDVGDLSRADADVTDGRDGDVAADADVDGDADADVGSDVDGDGDADGDALVLHAVGMATVAGEGLAAGSMRLTEVGFEGGGRSCAGSLCLWVGVMP